MSIDEAMEQCEDRNDMLMGGCTYFNNWISKKSAKDIYSFKVWESRRKWQKRLNR